MILNDLFEGRMNDLDIEYQDYKKLEPVAFYSRYKMTPDEWASKYWSLIRSRETVHEEQAVDNWAPFIVYNATLKKVILRTNDIDEAHKEAVEWAEEDDIVTRVYTKNKDLIFEVDGYEEAQEFKAEHPEMWKGVSESSAKERWTQGAEERQRKHDEIEARRQQAAKQGKTDVPGAISRLEKELEVREGVMSNLHAELADKYRELAPKIEKYKDSYLAGQLYDALEAIAIEHGAELEFKRMLAGARNSAHMDYDTNPGGFQNWFWYLPFADDQDVAEADHMTASGRARQQASRYNPNSETYRAQPIPSISDKDITQKSRQVSRVSHRDLVTRQDDLDDPIEKTELKIDQQRLQQLIKRQINALKPIEQEILIDRYWHELPYAQIGKRLNLSVERIRQIEAKALRKLRHPSRSADTKPFLDPDYVKPPTPTPMKSVVNPELAFKTGYNDAMSGQLHRFKTSYLSSSSNEPYDAGYEAGKRKLQSANLNRTSDIVEEQLDEKQDACYHKVKSRYKVWPSAYASGALVQCRKKGAANWGNKSKK